MINHSHASVYLHRVCMQSKQIKLEKQTIVNVIEDIQVQCVLGSFLKILYFVSLIKMYYLSVFSCRIKTLFANGWHSIILAKLKICPGLKSTPSVSPKKHCRQDQYYHTESGFEQEQQNNLHFNIHMKNR